MRTVREGVTESVERAVTEGTRPRPGRPVPVHAPSSLRRSNRRTSRRGRRCRRRGVGGSAAAAAHRRWGRARRGCGGAGVEAATSGDHTDREANHRRGQRGPSSGPRTYRPTGKTGGLHDDHRQYEKALRGAAGKRRNPDPGCGAVEPRRVRRVLARWHPYSRPRDRWAVHRAYAGRPGETRGPGPRREFTPLGHVESGRIAHRLRTGRHAVHAADRLGAHGTGARRSAAFARLVARRPVGSYTSPAMRLTYDGNLAPSALHLVPASGGPERALTDSVALNTNPVWLPGARALLFISNRDGGRDVYQLALRAPPALRPARQRASPPVSTPDASVSRRTAGDSPGQYLCRPQTSGPCQFPPGTRSPCREQDRRRAAVSASST